MRKGKVYLADRLAGEIFEVSPHEYVFRYDNDYYADPTSCAISLTMPKTKQEYRSDHLPLLFQHVVGRV